MLYALAEPLDGMIDVTISYAGNAAAPTLWQLVTGRVSKIIVRAELRAIPAELRGRNFREDPDFRQALQAWMGNIWREKDELISRSKAG